MTEHKIILPSWEETVARLKEINAYPMPYKPRDIISEYRGHNIVKTQEGSMTVYKGRHVVARCATAWGCICYIDEVLSP